MRMPRLVLLFAFTLASVAATPVWAQRPGAGRGGFGGGFGGGQFLLGQKSVQEELKLDEEQIKKVGEQAEKQREQFGGLQDLDASERRAKIQELAKENSEALLQILKPEQQARFKEISLQQRGTRAFAEPEVAAALNLTAEQKEKVKAINDSAQAEMRELFQGGNQEGAREKLFAARKANEEKSLGLLNDEQKAAWKKLTGEPFKGELAPPGGRGNRRGGRARGGQARDGNAQNDRDRTTPSESSSASSPQRPSAAPTGASADAAWDHVAKALRQRDVPEWRTGKGHGRHHHRQSAVGPDGPGKARATHHAHGHSHHRRHAHGTGRGTGHPGPGFHAFAGGHHHGHAHRGHVHRGQGHDRSRQFAAREGSRHHGPRHFAGRHESARRHGAPRHPHFAGHSGRARHGGWAHHGSWRHRHHGGHDRQFAHGRGAGHRPPQHAFGRHGHGHSGHGRHGHHGHFASYQRGPGAGGHHGRGPQGHHRGGWQGHDGPRRDHRGSGGPEQRGRGRADYDRTSDEPQISQFASAQRWLAALESQVDRLASQLDELRRERLR